MERLIKLSNNGFGWPRLGGIRESVRFAPRYIDFLIIPWFLDLGLLFAYVLARGISLFVPFALKILGAKAAPLLSVLFNADDQSQFRAAAARINLGYLMVCGSVSIIVLSIVPHLTGSIKGLDPAFEDILIWLIVGQAAPVLFGATGLLMHAVGRGSFYDLLYAVTAAFFLIGVCALHNEGGVLIAQTFAAAQLTHAIICALLLTQCGVWPGLTALFHKEIKLF